MTTKQKAKSKAPKAKAEVVEEVREVSKELVVPQIEPVLVPATYKSKLSRNQIDLVKRTIAKGASDDELKMFLYVCERTGLDPFTKQIHLVPRWDSKLGAEVRTPIVGIDGLRSIAERTGVYAGNDDPIFDDEEKPTKATVTVYKIVDHQRVPFTASARYAQYVPKKKDGSVASPLWVKMPHLMLGKCAEALALRKAFPAVMSGLYVAEEMQQTTATLTSGENQGPSDFDKAKAMIGKVQDVDGLEKAKMRLTESAKYPAKQKKELLAIVDARIAELEKQHAPEEVPQLQPADDVGEIASDL